MNKKLIRYKPCIVNDCHLNNHKEPVCIEKKLLNQSVLTEIVFFLVVVKPTISHKTKNVNRNLKEGETANLTCNATGYPEPTITWYREKEGKR